MSTDPKYTPSGDAPNSDKPIPPSRKGGDAEQNARKWSGGSKAAKGRTSADKKGNENATEKS